VSLPEAPARKARILLPATAFAASSALLFLGTGLHPVWWLTWLAPLPLLLVAPRVARGRAFWMAALAWFLGSANMWRYFLIALGLPLPAVLLVSTIPGLFFGLCVLLFRGLVLRGALFEAALSFPALWVAAEYLNGVTSRHGTFPNVGNSQMEFLPIVQIASMTGIWGIGFCLFLLPATIAAVLGTQGSASQKRRLATTAGGFLALVIGYGAWRLAATSAPERWVKVGLTATGAETSFPRDDAGALKLLREYSDRTASLAAQGAEVVVLPEKIALVLDGWLHGRMAVLRGVESGFTVARAAKQGLLTVSDDRGRILAEQDAATPRVASLVASAPVRHDDTIYARLGDWFAWLDIGALTAMLVFRRPRRAT
jgi:apolipoprotein N-acyltransferase